MDQVAGSAREGARRAQQVFDRLGVRDLVPRGEGFSEERRGQEGVRVCERGNEKKESREDRRSLTDAGFVIWCHAVRSFSVTSGPHCVTGFRISFSSSKREIIDKERERDV